METVKGNVVALDPASKVSRLAPILPIHAGIQKILSNGVQLNSDIFVLVDEGREDVESSYDR